MRAATFLFRAIWLSFVVVIAENTCIEFQNCVDCKKDNDINRCTQCTVGYYINSTGACSKCQSTCVTCVSRHNCSDCEAGKYGSWCSHQCDPNCIQTECYQYNGTCVHGCPSGYYQAGSNCYKCSQYIQNCEECTDYLHCTRCASGYTLWSSGDTTECHFGCPPGTWGVQCHNICFSNCTNLGCHETNGFCLTCTRYTYGQRCEFQCRDGCNEDAGNNVCDRDTGQCIYGCKPGYTGTACENPPSVVDGQWGKWSEVGSCSVTCGSGSKSRNRSCDNPAPQNDGQTCKGSNVEMTYCNQASCPVGGQWGQWSEYGPCSGTCGSGSKSRNRSCDNPAPQNGGQPCNGSNVETTDCYQASCPDGPVGLQKEPSGSTAGTISGSDSNGTVVGGAAGGAVLFVVLCVVLAVTCLFRRRNQGQTGKDGEEVFYENDTTATTVAHDFEINGYNTFPTPGGSRQAHNDHQNEDYVYAQPDKPKKDKVNDSVENQNEENVYSIPHKDKTKSSNGKENGNKKSKGGQEALHIPPVPSKLPHYMEDDDLEEINENNIHEMDTTDGKIAEQGGTYYNTTGLIRRRIPIEKLADTVAGKSEDEFLKEYLRLTDGLSRDYTAAVKKENKYRNRYKKIFPYDDTRVKLTGGTSDYINASYIDGYQQQKAYVACLGPTETTTDNYALFWTMVWQQKAEKIVMLTKLMEGEKMKCGQYWPGSTSESYGDITVYRISEINYAEFSIRNFEVDKNSERRRVCQIHYIAWPDRGVPNDVTSLLEFRHKVVAIPTTLNGPTIVHCSAGIGRTGTYVALDMLIKEGSAEKSVDVFGCVNGIRGQRVNLVQNVDQYKFLHHAVVHELTLPSQMLSSENLACSITADGRTDLRRQFEQLKTVIQRTPDMEAESITRNRDFKTKNRKGADVPGDRHRVKLNSIKPGSNDYVNATFVDGYMTVKQFIVAQTPLSETLVDFVGLVMEENIACIVSMDPDMTMDKSVGNYLPPLNQTLKIGIYAINCTKSESLASYVIRTLDVSKRHGRGIEKKTVYHFQQTIWKKNEPVPNDAASYFVRMVSEVEQTAAKIGGNGGTLIHCLNAAERSGLFCVVALLIQKLRYEQKISVFNTVRLFRSKRQKAIPTEEQYIFCHECVVAHQASINNTYTNVE